MENTKACGGVRSLVDGKYRCASCDNTAEVENKPLKWKYRVYVPPRRGAAYVQRSAAKKVVRSNKLCRRRA